jgi:hypothetical protein
MARFLLAATVVGSARARCLALGVRDGDDGGAPHHRRHCPDAADRPDLFGEDE